MSWGKDLARACAHKQPQRDPIRQKPLRRPLPRLQSASRESTLMSKPGLKDPLSTLKLESGRILALRARRKRVHVTGALPERTTLKQIIRDTLYTDIEFVRNRFINDDCPVSIVVSAATRNKVADVGIKLLDAKRNKGKAPQTLVRRFLSLVNLHKYQLKLMTLSNVMSPQTLSTNLYALKVVTDSTIDLLM